jgi:hypothetical protein
MSWNFRILDWARLETTYVPTRELSSQKKKKHKTFYKQTQNCYNIYPICLQFIFMLTIVLWTCC